MPTKRDIEYLRAVLEEERERGEARLKDVASRVGVRPPTALEALRKLEDMGYLSHEHRRGYKLTEKGLRLCEEAIRKHRIIETYLVFFLGYNPDAACRYASRFDIYVPLDVVDRMCELLGHPDKCPHGMPIPPCSHRRG